ncbi:NAD-dependent malic enzyme [uncultured Paludibaculum sp.]|uniref:NAD-dependent malic enzyme n=1 Tax=uncultured Paludibaculum sp. TaxID=1765020 RepID=UPI002AABE3B5|nr:NAD-dependent malic enzyme [uncultured Paludibaculum sp.]
MRQRTIPLLAPTTKHRPNQNGHYETTSRGLAVLSSPLLNKGTAFSAEERRELGLTGLLPPEISTLETQVVRAYLQYEGLTDALSKNIYLTALHDRNEVLFYRLFSEHLREMIPIVNDLTVGMAMEQYHHECRPPRGVYLSIDHADAIEEAFANLGAGAEDIDLILATDAEQILGIGDWGVGGIEVSIGKLAIYTAAGGIDPTRVIPVMLDVGTNREQLRDDPTYVGNRHARIRGDRYDAFIESYINVTTKLFPNALMQWEDFSSRNGRSILERYRNHICTFNDDIQGTGAITLAAVISAIRVCGTPFRNQRVVIFGAGTAGIGIADQIREAMIHDGLAADDATKRFWCLDRKGLLTSDMTAEMGGFQLPYARPSAEVKGWRCDGTNGGVELLEVVRRVKPTMLIGASAAAGAFSEEVVKAMAANTDRPIIFSLSHPKARAEARPADLIAWSDGRALIATGCAFAPVTFKGVTYVVAQINNAMLYPGLALGAIVARASRISAGMFAAAASAVSSMVTVRQPGASLLPHIDDLRSVSATVAVAVVEAAIEEGLARARFEDIVQQVQDAMWQPEYRRIQAT